MNKHSDKQLTNNPLVSQEKVGFMCVKCEKPVRFGGDARPAGCIHTCRQECEDRDSRVIANLLWQKVVELCGPLLFNLHVWKGEEETAGVLEVNGYFLNPHQEKGVRTVCVCTRMEMNK